MTLWLSIAAIVAIMIFVILREYPAMIRFDLKSEQTGKVTRSKKVSKSKMPLTEAGLRSAKWSPKYKGDPQIFVDSEEIGHEPFL